MKVPFRLRRLPAHEPATALLVLSPAAADVLEVCTQLAGEPPPRVFAVAGGFLLQLENPVTDWVPRTIRLRRLSGHLFVPADADLVPTLLEDEREALGRARGLVFLPGGKVLGFAPDQPLALSSLVAGGPIHRRRWAPLPEPLPLADRVREISLELPVPPPEEILAGAGQDIGTEEPWPESAGASATLAGQVGMGMGRALMGLGNLLGMKGLAGMGAEMIRRALEKAPRLSEALLGRQEAALRALLRKFREGNVDEALKRAVPLLEPGDRGGMVPAVPRLPVNNLLYSLGTLLARRPGTVGILLSSPDVHRELVREYRKAAVQAALRGDYRRAAYIYGKLLRDFRMAANTLAQGGLHHDAAVLYLTKLQDTYAAARAFEAAGEFDRALKLYRQRGDHVLAGDLLRRTGEEEAALAEYLRAADQLATSGSPLAAGDLLLARAGRPDLAQDYFESGWARRPDPNAVVCALRLTRLHADAGAADRLLTLVAEADAYLGPPGRENEARQFYNEVARLTNRTDLAAVRGELRDRALLGLAGKLRQRAAVETRPGGLIATLFGRGHPWPAALVSDAHYALKEARRPSPLAVSASTVPVTVIRTQNGTDTVTAACVAPVSGDVFLGFRSGAVVGYRQVTGELVRLPVTRGPVASLAVDATGDFLVVLQTAPEASGHLSSYVRNLDGTYQIRERRVLEEPGAYALTPQVVHDPGPVVGLWDDGLLRLLRSPMLLPWGSLLLPFEPREFAFALLQPGGPPVGPTVVVGSHDLLCIAPIAEGFQVSWDSRQRIALGWGPQRPTGCSLQSAPLSWGIRESEGFELAGLNEFGMIHWSVVPGTGAVTTAVSEPGYLAAAIIRPGLLAGVRKERVDWLRPQGTRMQPTAQSRVAFSSPVACFAGQPTHELIVVDAAGDLIRVPVPS